MSPKAKVVIVGGGIAGIKAAIELDKNGVDYVILEAKDRLGGRMKTVQGENTKYDVGASWFHDTLTNPLFDEENSLPEDQRVKYYYDDLPSKYFDENGEVPLQSRLGPISQEIAMYVQLEMEKDIEADQPLYEAVWKYFKEKKQFLTDEQVGHALGYIRNYELWHGITIDKQSAKYFDIKNNGRNALTKNYDTVLDRHTSQLSKAKYELHQAVKSIVRTDQNKKVKVTTIDNKEFIADFAIVTVPQTILSLKEGEPGAIKFEPKLPEKLTSSLQKIHFGALGKVILEFDECFWGKEYERFSCLSSPPEGFVEAIIKNEEIPKFPNDKVPKSWDYPLIFLNYAADYDIPSLVAITQSPLTDYLESHQDKAWEFMKPYVQVISGKKDIPDPKNVITSEWTVDPYQRGSYTACFPDDDPISGIVALEEGFGNVRFAGEHTILDGCGCVHGAWESGRREARYILGKLK